MTDQPAWILRLGKCTGNHMESMLSVADGLVIELPELRNRLDRAISTGATTDVQRLGHTLKSSLRYINEGEDVEKAEALEQAGAEGRLDEAARLMDELRPRIESWTTTIQQWIRESS